MVVHAHVLECVYSHVDNYSGATIVGELRGSRQL